MTITEQYQRLLDSAKDDSYLLESRVNLLVRALELLPRVLGEVLETREHSTP